MPGSNSSADENLEGIPDDATKFDKSLQELKDLRSQLHHAANYCESTFLNATEKRKVVESTKEYLCRAIVTVVDHLGSVSANLDRRLSKSNAVSETELRIDSLKQRLLTCQQFSHKLSLRRHCWNADFPRCCSRYLSPPTVDHLQSPNELLRISGGPVAAAAKSTRQFVADEEVPLFLYTYNCKQSLVENSKSKNSLDERKLSPASVLPVHSGLSVVPKSQNPYFQFQASPKLKNNTTNRRFVQNKMSLVRRLKEHIYK